MNEAARLFGDCLSHARILVSQIRYCDARHTIEIGAVVRVVQHSPSPLRR